MKIKKMIKVKMNIYDTHVALSRQQSLEILKNPMGAIYDCHYDGKNLYVPTTFSLSDYMKNDLKPLPLYQKISRPPTRKKNRLKWTKSRVEDTKSLVETILNDDYLSDFVMIEHL